MLKNKTFYLYQLASLFDSKGMAFLGHPVDKGNMIRDSRKSRQKMVKNTTHFRENRKKITAVYIAVNFLKLMVSNSRKIYILGKIHTTIMSRSHISPVSNKAHGLW